MNYGQRFGAPMSPGSAAAYSVVVARPGLRAPDLGASTIDWTALIGASVETAKSVAPVVAAAVAKHKSPPARKAAPAPAPPPPPPPPPRPSIPAWALPAGAAVVAIGAAFLFTRRPAAVAAVAK